MFWTIYAVVGIGCFLLMKVLRSYIAARRKLPATPRSTKAKANIGQILPADILEELFTYCDPNTLLSCTMVNKHWYYSSQQIRDQVYRSWGAHIGDLIGKLRSKTPEFDPKAITANLLMSDKEENTRDQLYAQSFGKNLIVADLANAREIKYAMTTYNEAHGKTINIADGYLLKFRTKMYERSQTQFMFQDHQEQFCSVLKQQMKLLQRFVKQWKSGKECEIICEFDDINTDYNMHIKQLKRIRIIEQKKKIAGITLDTNLFKAIFLVVMPCLLFDYSNNVSAATKLFMNNIFSVLVILFIGFMIGFTPVENSKHIRFHPSVQKFHNIIGVVCGLAWLLIASSMRDWSFKFGHYGLLLVFGKLYTSFTIDLFNSRTRKLFLPFMVISAILLTVILDWTDIFGSSIENLSQLFLNNVIFHMKFGIGLVLFFDMVACFETNAIKLENFVPRKELVLIHLMDISVALYITLYNPINT